MHVSNNVNVGEGFESLHPLFSWLVTAAQLGA
jgi:hypothetical protein